MCEIFGFSGKKSHNIEPLLKEFFSQASENPDGWGLYLHDGIEGSLSKEDIRADRSSRLKNLLKKDLVSKSALAHIRLATIGYDDIDNTHPFVGYDKSGREWALIHNGTIFESDVLTKYFYEQEGDTDSERIFLYLIDLMNEGMAKKGGPLDEEERFRILEEMVSHLSPSNKLNLIIFDGDILYAHTNYKDSLFEMKNDGASFLSTKPLSYGKWDAVPFTRLMAYKNGERIRSGFSHGIEYIPDEENIKALYLAYSGL